jgi:exodeoxyribonuclease VII small subunit
MANKKFSYKQALEELETILAEIENDELDLDVLSEKVKRASYLIKECKSGLKKTGEEIDSILEDWEDGEV